MRFVDFVSRRSLLVGFAACALSSAATAQNRPWVDFAELEHGGGCQSIVAAAGNPDVIQAWNQERLDQLYACSKAGPMPDGFMRGRVLFATGGAFDQFVQYASRLGVPLGTKAFKVFAEMLWKGKQFYKKDKALLNKIGPDVESILGFNIKGQMRFPAHVYCGQSLLDSRRESIIIDYAFTERVVVDGDRPYNDKLDWIAGNATSSGKYGLKIRDEIRMIRPGFYLGRAYMDRVFILNFILTTDNPVQGGDECWGGYATAGN